MKKTKFVIDGDYYFGSVADGPRPCFLGDSEIHLQLEHDDVMEMGEYFNDEDPTEVDFIHNFGLKEELDELLAERLIEDLKEEFQREDTYDDDDDLDSDAEEEVEEEPDFYTMAYERMGEMYHTWSEELKQECIDYYLAHKDDEDENDNENDNENDMYLDIVIDVYEAGPHGHGGECTIEDWIDVSEEVYQKVKECYKNGIEDLEEMKIPELREKLDAIYEEHTDFARERNSNSDDEEDDEDDIEEESYGPSITVRLAYYAFEDEEDEN